MTHRKDFERWMAGWAVTQSEGKWLVAYEMASKEGDTPGESICFLKQAPRIWHAFYRERATGSGTTPRAALTGGLGDAISTDAELRSYCKMVMDAPASLASQFGGLSAAQDQCASE
jgi:hypothetical protein